MARKPPGHGRGQKQIAAGVLSAAATVGLTYLPSAPETDATQSLKTTTAMTPLFDGALPQGGGTPNADAQLATIHATPERAASKSTHLATQNITQSLADALNEAVLIPADTAAPVTADPLTIRTLERIDLSQEKWFLDFIIDQEGLVLTSYNDNGDRTISAGFNLTTNAARKDMFCTTLNVDEAFFNAVCKAEVSITKPQAMALLKVVTQEMQGIVNTKLRGIPVSAYELAAYTSIAFNSPSYIGPNAIEAARQGNPGMIKWVILDNCGGDIYASRRAGEFSLVCRTFNVSPDQVHKIIPPTEIARRATAAQQQNQNG